MSKEQNIKSFTATDIERYHKGLLSPKERNAIEKAALDDPLLADALEGYGQVTRSMHEDLSDLRKRLENRIMQTRGDPVAGSKASFSWWKAAAMIVVIIGAGLLVYQLVFNKKHSELAQVQKNSSAANVVKDSMAPPTPSIGTANNNKEADSATIGLVKDDQKTSRDNKKPRSEETAVKPGDKKEETAADGIADAPGKQNEKPPVAESQKAAELKEEISNNQLPKSDESSAKNRRTERPTSVTADVEYRQAESKPAAATNAPQVNKGFANQSNVFRGRITDNNNNALPFSNITNLNDNIGTYSDARGNFVLTSPDSVLNVQIRSLGFETTNTQIFPAVRENKIQLEGDKSITANVLDTVRRNTNRSLNAKMTLEEPEPADGWSNYDIYLANNLKIPETFKSKESNGTVELTFEVDKNGMPYNIVVKKSLCESCDKEAIRLIKEGPKWKRKLKKGRATVTVSF